MCPQCGDSNTVTQLGKNRTTNTDIIVEEGADIDIKERPMVEEAKEPSRKADRPPKDEQDEIKLARLSFTDGTTTPNPGSGRRHRMFAMFGSGMTNQRTDTMPAGQEVIMPRRWPCEPWPTFSRRPKRPRAAICQQTDWCSQDSHRTAEHPNCL